MDNRSNSAFLLYLKNMNLKRILIPFIFGVFAVSLSSYTQAQNCDPDTTIITSEKAWMFYLEKPALKKPTNKPVSVIMNTRNFTLHVFRSIL